MTKGRVIALFISVALVLGLALPAVAAGPPDNPGKGSSGLTKIVFVHYPKGVEAKGGIPGKPGGGDAKADKEWYKYQGVHWDNTSVAYVIEDINGTDDDTYEDAIEAAFETWEATGASIDFTGEIVDSLGILIVPSSFVPTLGYPDGTPNGVHEVGWMSFDDYGLPDNAIAVTAVWWDSDKHIVEADMAMNTDLPWAQNTVTGDPDEAIPQETEAYDVQNIAIHEAGHFLMLLDLYMPPSSEQTMHGYGALGELKKRSLESGDIAGILAIYPAAP